MTESNGVLFCKTCRIPLRLDENDRVDVESNCVHLIDGVREAKRTGQIPQNEHLAVLTVREG